VIVSRIKFEPQIHFTEMGTQKYLFSYVWPHSQIKFTDFGSRLAHRLSGGFTRRPFGEFICRPSGGLARRLYDGPDPKSSVNSKVLTLYSSNFAFKVTLSHRFWKPFYSVSQHCTGHFLIIFFQELLF